MKLEQYTAYFQDSFTTLYNHDCRSMYELPDSSIQCCVTSPPYWGLRKYAGNQDIPEWGCALGLEPTPELYVQHIVEICQEIKRVLRTDGVFWLNIGDSYNGSGGEHKHDKGQSGLTNLNLKPKDLCLIPERLAIALQADGWWVRSRIAWVKPNPMPESVRDRPTDSWEHIWMLTKSARYYYDSEAVREAGATPEGDKARHGFGGNKNNEPSSLTCHSNHPGKEWEWTPNRNLRSAWEFPTQPFKSAHFAVFPEELPERCIKASTSEKGCCPKCGKPWVRIVEKPEAPHDGHTEAKEKGGPQANTMRISLLIQAARERGGEYANETKTLGWRPDCGCNAGEPTPCTVLDCFCGSGTTLWVAKKLGRRSVGYELSTEYCKLAMERNRQGGLL